MSDKLSDNKASSLAALIATRVALENLIEKDGKFTKPILHCVNEATGLGRLLAKPDADSDIQTEVKDDGTIIVSFRFKTDKPIESFEIGEATAHSLDQNKNPFTVKSLNFERERVPT